MRVLVYPHDLNMGGSQTNAIEIAAKIRDLGVESIIFGRPGVLNGRIDELGLEFIESPDPGRRPSIKIAKLLRSIAKERKIDVLHGYEWPPSLECVAAAYGLKNTVAVSTVMSMAVAPFIPKSMPLVVGTEQIAAAERQSGRRNVSVVEPPVDLDHNVAPPADELAAFRRRWGLRHDATLVVCVSRLAHELKSEGILSAIRAMGDQLADLDLQFLIVGDGPARDQISVAAAEANAKTQPDRVILTGELLDPRAAYAVADIVLGMGGSALRALAFSKPLIVQGERGFFQVLTDETWPTFAWQGWYGIGSQSSVGSDTLAKAIRYLLADRDRYDDIARMGRHLVEARFSLSGASVLQCETYLQAGTQRSPTSPLSAAASVRQVAQYILRRKAAQLRKRRNTDDFNSRPIAATHPEEAPPSTNPTLPTLVYLAGSHWNSVAGTDIQLARAIAGHRPVVWVDPPASALSSLRTGTRTSRVSREEPGITRISPISFPGVSRPGMRAVARWQANAGLKYYLRQNPQVVGTVFSSSPEPLLPPWSRLPVQRVYFATDDFVAGAELMGMSRRHLSTSRRQNLRHADIVLAVTDDLAGRLRSDGSAIVLSNGCDAESLSELDSVQRSSVVNLAPPIAGVIGQFNARLDLTYLAEVARRGISLLLVGPCTVRDGAFAQAFTQLTTLPNVQWVGGRSATEMPAFLATMSVGLTPYADSQFNRASCPLKTLEYLAAGLPVVSSALPAARCHDPRLVAVAQTAREFADLTELAFYSTSPTAPERRAYARSQSWQRRAAELETILSQRAGQY